ncbi:MAG: hypothetical protein HVK41_03395 [Pelagibacteraceae bacterium]|jgi:DNA-binding MarR family transcriptional regulator|nr:hypothetical protein [Pelagibacteraceae bacterium]MDP6784227.1 hypothetical protein [Alphaproteobacteria bacterium]MBO6466850.1 hypothetical protein [Pelagibacteraceae bacterium]MBO6467162.1 hypothetical protein [Pelagibacteraceae bacterium]MBO6470048.1 hypothetical protein [Pelagibacteraceae bacterium]|tara:strand:+ start:205 stop:666 length:462 start_codon:yes stop_codon:yes gene_type:complete
MADTSLAERKIGLLIWQLSNLWQSKLRKILKDYKLTLNEYLILESIFDLSKNQKELSQNRISIFAGIDVSVASVTFKLLENKKLIMRRTKKDNRKKIVEMLANGINLHNKVKPLILKEELNIFNKLQNEIYNFKNLIKLLLGKRVRIKAKKVL